jgi:hypothetical protein
MSRRRAGVTDSQNYHTPDPRRINSPAKKLYRRVDVRRRAAGGNAVAAPPADAPAPDPRRAGPCTPPPPLSAPPPPLIVYVAANLAPARPDEVRALSAHLDTWWKP